MATTGGNLLQRTRCAYFYDTATPCNKREPGSRLLGDRRHQPHPRDPRHQRSLHRDASVRHVRRARRTRCQGARDGTRRRARHSRSTTSIGCRAITPEIDTNLHPDEIVTAVELPAQGFASNYSYLKIRDRLSYAFALVSIAAALELEGGRSRRRGLRSAASRTSRGATREPKRRCAGSRQTRPSFARAADILLRDARGYEHNAFKIDLARRGIVRTLTQAAQATPQSQSDKKIR